MIEERNYGIDVLKILSMFMVVVLHVIQYGGMYDAVAFSSGWITSSIIEIFCYICVNLFALITGYLCINKNFKYKNIISLWIRALFYSVLFSLLFYEFNLFTLIKSFFPVASDVWWYFSAYFCFALFIPFINKYLNSIDEFEHRKLLFVIIFVMCIIGMLTRGLGTDVVNIERGFSPIWLMSLYIFGAYIKLYNFKFKNRNKKLYLGIYVLCSLLAFLSKILIVKFSFLNNIFAVKTFFEYNSILTFISSISVFLFFIKIKVRSEFKLILVFFSNISFSVYLIHFHDGVRNIIINNLFTHFLYMPFFQMVFMILFTALIIYVVCTVIDVFRHYLFKILRVDKLSSWLDEKIVSLLTKKG